MATTISVEGAVPFSAKLANQIGLEGNNVPQAKQIAMSEELKAENKTLKAGQENVLGAPLYGVTGVKYRAISSLSLHPKAIGSSHQ